MTLIAAFRCEEGVVLCADQQETVGGIRVAVNKIAPQDCNHFQLAIAGAGHGDLIDGFTEKVRLDVMRWGRQVNEDVARENIRNQLLDFHDNEVKGFPADISEKHNDFLICIKPKQSQEIFLWEARGTSITRVNKYSLIGIEEAIYKHELKKLYPHKPNGFKAVLLAAHLFTLAKETSNYVGGQLDLIFVSAHGMRAETPGFVREVEQHIVGFNKAIARLVLTCLDTSVENSEFYEQVEEFRMEALRLRYQFSKRDRVFSSISKSLHPELRFDDYTRVPINAEAEEQDGKKGGEVCPDSQNESEK